MNEKERRGEMGQSSASLLITQKYTETVRQDNDVFSSTPLGQLLWAGRSSVISRVSTTPGNDGATLPFPGPSTLTTFKQVFTIFNKCQGMLNPLVPHQEEPHAVSFFTVNIIFCSRDQCKSSICNLVLKL